MRQFVTFAIAAGLLAGPALANDDPSLRYLDARETAPGLMVPPRAPAGSLIEALEMARVRALIAGATPERRALAKADDVEESASVFNLAAGRDLAVLPATAALLAAIQAETEVVIVAAKAYFHMARPYQIDPGLPHCGTGTSELKGYPSGHAGFGYSVGWALTRLDPAHAAAVLARVQDYALSREICGNHLQSDTEASRVIGTFVAERLLADPRLAAQVKAARAELAGH